MHEHYLRMIVWEFQSLQWQSDHFPICRRRFFIVLVLLGILLILAQTSPLAPFIYTLF